MASVSFKNVNKIFSGGVEAVKDFNLDIDDKEFIVVVGPSGCGKSTVLRMIAGLEELSSGELVIGGEVVNNVEPKDRDIAMVFQNYALYPHMTVYENMAFGLKLRSVPKAQIDEQIALAASALDIIELLDRKPKQLSGGQCQRVALGRAIVRQPKVFLLDEPLSSLDAKLRVQMRTEIIKLHNDLKTTFVYVTHDQVEAMTMGTRIVVMKDGVIQQVDSPQSLYDNPKNLFVASFLGSPQMNFFDTMLVKEDEKLYAVFGENKILIPRASARRLMDERYIGQEVVMGVRPEDIHEEEVFIANSPQTIVTAKIDVLEKLGNETVLYMKIDGKDEYAIARVDARSKAAAGDEMKLAIDARHIHFFDAVTEESILGIPSENQIDAKLSAVGDGLEVSFGSSRIELDRDIAERFVDFGCVNSDVVLEIKPENITDKKTFERLQLQQIKTDGNAFGAYEINGVIDFTEKHQNYVAGYVKIEGKNGYIVALLPKNTEFCGGDKVTLCGNINRLQIIDPKTGDAVIAQSKVTGNVTKAICNIKGDKAVVTFGKTKLTFNKKETVFESKAFLKLQSEAAVKSLPIDITLGSLYFSIDKDDIAQNSKTCIDARLEKVETIGIDTVIYAKVEGFEDNITAVVCQNVVVNKGEKFKLAFDPAGISLGAPQSVKETLITLSNK